MEEKEKGDEVTGGRPAVGPVPAVGICGRSGASDCGSHKGGSAIGMSDRQEMSTTYRHPHRSEGSLGQERRGRGRSLPLRSRWRDLNYLLAL